MADLEKSKELNPLFTTVVNGRVIVSTKKLTRKHKEQIRQKHEAYKKNWRSHVEMVRRIRPEELYRLHPQEEEIEMLVAESKYFFDPKLNAEQRREIERLKYEDRFANEYNGIRYSEKREILKKIATPAWVNWELINAIYDERDKRNKEKLDDPWVVDHFYPILGKTVCGLHVHTNLVLIRSRENSSKSNKHPEDFYSSEYI